MFLLRIEYTVAINLYDAAIASAIAAAEILLDQNVGFRLTAGVIKG
jgi:hypothetical protein